MRIQPGFIELEFRHLINMPRLESWSSEGFLCRQWKYLQTVLGFASWGELCLAFNDCIASAPDSGTFVKYLQSSCPAHAIGQLRGRQPGAVSIHNLTICSKALKESSLWTDVLHSSGMMLCSFCLSLRIIGLLTGKPSYLGKLDCQPWALRNHESGIRTIVWQL